ncbi:MAG: methyl-accepting chemotaxis protein, partial [Treponema sp.]|nr:methyl-accepting chemotaxis protein [Treponema sp.]
MLLVNSSLLHQNEDKIGGKRKTSIKQKFLVFTVSLFLVILAGGGVAFFINMDSIVRTDVVQKLSRLIEFKASTLESSTAKEIAIALKMADSPIIREYFMSPNNAELERLAFMEIAGYRRAFTGNNVFWINDTDHNYYFGDEFSYTLDPADPSSNWYSSIIKNPGPYFFNVDTDIGTKKTMLWINVPVMAQG